VRRGSAGGLRTDPLPGVDAIVALNVRTGELIWQFQTVHHNLFDYDLPAQPTLIDVKRNGQDIPAVAQPTKTGFLWVLNRETGQPLFPVVERAVAQSDVPGEHSSPTQPVPLLPPPLALQRVTDADIWGITPLDRDACLRRIHALRNDGLFTPPSLRGSIVVPYFGGGSNWGGMGYDPRAHLAILNAMNIPGYVRLFPSGDYAALKRAGGPDEVAPMIGAPFAACGTSVGRRKIANWPGSGWTKNKRKWQLQRQLRHLVRSHILPIVGSMNCAH
jgi:quinoprotein glucose dehydrogenase